MELLKKYTEEIAEDLNFDEMSLRDMQLQHQEILELG